MIIETLLLGVEPRKVDITCACNDNDNIGGNASPRTVGSCGHAVERVGNPNDVSEEYWRLEIANYDDRATPHTSSKGIWRGGCSAEGCTTRRVSVDRNDLHGCIDLSQCVGNHVLLDPA